MFKHILLPTDGSKLSNRAVKRGVEFAKATKARVTSIHVVPEFRMIADEGFAIPMSAELKQRFEGQAQARAKTVVDKVGKLAKAAKVRHDGVVVSSDFPYQQIIETARRRKCDLIIMASHGRRGLSSLLLGSETSKVLTHSKVPVLVVR